MCGALVGTLSNKKEFPTTTSSGVVADHREALDAALLDYNIFKCCLLRGVLAAAAQGSGAVLAVLV